MRQTQPLVTAEEVVATFNRLFQETEETVLVGGGGDGGTESPPDATASSSVKAPSGGRAWSATEIHSLVEVE